MYGQVEVNKPAQIPGKFMPYTDGHWHANYVSKLLLGTAIDIDPGLGNDYYLPRPGSYVTQARGIISYGANNFIRTILHQPYNFFSFPTSESDFDKYEFDILNMSVSFGNGITPSVRLLDDFIQKKDILVASTMDGSLDTNGSGGGNLWNSIVVGREYANLSYPGGSLHNNIDGPRPKPDIVSFNGASSFSAPIISSGAAMIMSYAKSKGWTNGESSDVLKAIIMAGSSKRYLYNNIDSQGIPIDEKNSQFDKYIWTNSSTDPLDIYYGAGNFNINNTYFIMEQGEHQRSTSYDDIYNRKQGGWAKGEDLDNTEYHSYLFEVDGTSNVNLTANLNWKRGVTVDYNGRTIKYDDLENLKMELWKIENGQASQLITYSDDSGNNVEHIYLSGLNALSNGKYEIRIINQSTDVTDYGFAWKIDYDGDLYETLINKKDNLYLAKNSQDNIIPFLSIRDSSGRDDISVSLSSQKGIFNVSALFNATVTGNASGNIDISGVSTEEMNEILDSLRYNPNHNQYGADTLTITVSDSDSNSDSVDININIIPELKTIYNINENTSNIGLEFLGLESGENMTYSIEGGDIIDNSFFTIENNQLQFKTSRNYEIDKHTYMLKLRFQNDHFNLLNTLSIIIKDINDVPVLSSFFSDYYNIIRDETVNLTIPEFSDEDGDSITYGYADSLPQGISFNPLTRILTGKITNLGDYTLIITVTDSNQASTNLELLFKVEDYFYTVQRPFLSASRISTGEGTQGTNRDNRSFRELRYLGYFDLWDRHNGYLAQGTGVMYGQTETSLPAQIPGKFMPYTDGSSHANYVSGLLLGSRIDTHLDYYLPRPGAYVSKARGVISYGASNFRKIILHQPYDAYSFPTSESDFDKYEFDILNMSVTFGNGANISVRLLDDFIKKKDILVATAQPGGLSTNASGSGNLWNSIVVGQEYADLSYPGGSVYNNIDGPRPKPDIVSFNGASSFSTPVISSGAAMIMSYAKSKGWTNGESSDVLKAIIMAGSSKRYLYNSIDSQGIPIKAENSQFDQYIWTNSSTDPLDIYYGAGNFNINNTYFIMEQGEHQRSTSYDDIYNRKQGGWAKGEDLDNTEYHSYLFEVDGTSNANLTANLNWKRGVTVDYNGRTIKYNDLENLKMELWKIENGQASQLITYSDDSGNNVEHIYLSGLNALSNGKYELRIINQSTDVTDYGFAWKIDYDGDLYETLINKKDNLSVATNSQDNIIPFLSIRDSSGRDDLSVSLSSQKGIFNVSTLFNATITGNASGNIDISGVSTEEMNEILDSLRYNPNHNQYGADTLTIMVSDSDSNSDSVDININIINISPSLTDVNYDVSESKTSIIDLSDNISKDLLDNIIYSIDLNLDASFFILDGSKLSFSSFQDYEKDKLTYQLAVKLQGGVASKIETLTVSLTNVNDIASKLTQTSFSVSENRTIINNLDTNLIKDNLDEISYKILNKFNGVLFQTNIDGKTLEFKDFKDYERDTKNYTLVIELQGTDSKTQTLTISLTNVNDIASQLTQTSFSVSENRTIINNLDTNLSKDDLDEISYKILNKFNGSLFQTNGGNLEFKSLKDYESDLRNYTLVIELQGTDSKIQTLTISLRNVNDIASKLTQTSFSISEDSTIINNLDTNLSKDDLDEISYKILNKFNGSLFQTNINGKTLEFKDFKDYERDTKNYTLVIELQGTDSKVQTLTVSLRNVNDIASKLTQTSFSISEDSTIINNLDTNLSKDDLDEISYKILNKFNGSLFQTNINGKTLEFKDFKDYERDARNYTLVIELQGTDSKVQTLTVNLTNVNDIASNLTQTSFSISEDRTIINNLDTNLSKDNLDEISYKILNKFNGSLFQTNGGFLEFKSFQDYERDTKNYTLVIELQGTDSKIQTLTVSLRNVNDIVSKLTQTSFSISEDRTIINNLDTNLIKDDLDEISYKILNKFNGVLFQTNGGRLEFKNFKDYERNAKNYTLVIELQGTDSKIQTLTISLRNVNDIASNLTQTSFSISEDRTIINNLDTNLIKDDLDDISYKILNKFNGDLFQTNSGRLEFKNFKDYEKDLKNYTLVIELQGTDSKIQTLTISLTNTIAPIASTLSDRSSLLEHNFLIESEKVEKVRKEKTLSLQKEVLDFSLNQVNNLDVKEVFKLILPALNSSVYDGGEEYDEFSYKNDDLYVSNNFELVREETKLSSILSITIASHLPTIIVDFDKILSFDPIENIDKLEKVSLYNQKNLREFVGKNLKKIISKQIKHKKEILKKLKK